MKVLFVQLRFELSMAVMCISSFLNSKGHQTDVIIIEGEDDQIRPDVIAFPVTTVDIKIVNSQQERKLKFNGGAYDNYS